MRTTIDIDDALLAEAKQYAAKRRKTLTSLISETLRLLLSQTQGKKLKTPVHSTTFKGKGVMPGVDLDCTSSLFDLMSESK